MTRDEFVKWVQASSKKGEKRILAEMKKLFGPLRDEYTQEEFEDYMRRYVLGEVKDEKYDDGYLEAEGKCRNCIHHSRVDGEPYCELLNYSYPEYDACQGIHFEKKSRRKSEW